MRCGDGKNVRDWVFVEDHCRGVELVLNRGRSGEVYNLASRGGRQNLEVLRAATFAQDPSCNHRKCVQDCLERLLDNAIKFTSHGIITVSLRERDGRAELEVTDTGCGIEPQRQARVLTPLAVAEKIEHHSEGCGLGLAIVKREVEVLRGEISFMSAGVDKGASFQLVFPLDIREKESA